MSESRPYRTRAASKAASVESTPAPISQPATPATPATGRRKGGRAANRLAPIAHDGDDDLPPIMHKTSKAYGSAGKLQGPVQMDFSQTQNRPEFALNTALAQQAALTGGFLPTVAENPTGNPIEDQTNTGPQDAPQETDNPQHGVQDPAIQNEGHTFRATDNPQHSVQDSTIQNEGHTIGATDSSAWAPRSGGSNLLQPLTDFFGIVANEIVEVFLYLNDLVTDIVLSGSFKFFMWFICFFFIYSTLEITHGPLLWFDPPVMHSARDSWISNTTLRGTVESQIRDFEKRLSIFERTGLFTPKPTPQIPRINWFEVGQGAVIDPYYSSPSYVPKAKFTSKGFFASLLTLQTYQVRPEPNNQGHVEALTHWNDGGLERWCAPSSRGKLQLTVNVARKIAPEQLIIEHIEKSATIRVGMAPREVELWIDIDDETIFEVLRRTITESYPALLENSSPDSDKELAPAQALPFTFLPIARFYYDVHNNQAVQHFIVPIDLAAMGVKTSRIAFRANSNWGSNDYTCVNRVRLYGVDMSGEPVEKLAEELKGGP